MAFDTRKESFMNRIIRKMVAGLFVCLLTMLVLAGCGGSGITQEQYDTLTSEKESIETELESVKSELETTKADLEKITTEYNEYTESMKPFDEMTVAQAEEEKARAEKEKKKIEEEEAAKKKAEEEEAARKEEEEKAAREAEEAKGYETGITYEELARTPDDYKGKKVKFSGKVLQVLEGDDSVQIRLAVNDDYDTVLFGEYDSTIVSSRVLEDDEITIYGISYGLISYDSTMGGKITIPAVSIDKIDQ